MNADAPTPDEDELHFSKPDAEQRVFIVHTGRTIGKSVWNAEMLKRLLEAESVKRTGAAGVFIIMDELPQERITKQLHDALDRVSLFPREVPTINPIGRRERAQWKQELNLHPAQRKAFTRAQKQPRTHRGRGR